ncbi:MAG: helix-turn-helix transcriptional regulator, partial [bacterium]
MTRSRTDYVAAKDRANLSTGDVIKMTCELNEMTQAELSRRSGVSPSNLSDIVHGRRPVGKAIAEKLARALNVSPAFILFAG